MKDFAKFETFKLNKTQMNAVAGGITCYVDFGDGQIELTVNPDLTFGEAVHAADLAYGRAFRGCKK
ncbi:hypothetical protein [uncultured Bacteroides sp.]|uniref:hypothetical protein n=1 Tax=uncultured Bacteroides sp. TaxID=162156 RepID=UPI0032B247EB